MSEEQRTLYARITHGPRAQGKQHFALTDQDGRLRGPFGDFLLSPTVGEALQELGSALRYHTNLTDRVRELAILAVAARHDSGFEREAHEALARALEFTEDELAAIRAQDMLVFSGDEALVGRTVLALLDGDLDNAQWKEARDGLGEAVVFELVTLVGYYSTLALQLRVFRANPGTDTPRRNPQPSPHPRGQDGT